MNIPFEWPATLLTYIFFKEFRNTMCPMWPAAWVFSIWRMPVTCSPNSAQARLWRLQWAACREKSLWVCSLCSETEWDSNIMNSKQVWESPETAVSPYLNESRKGSFLNVGAGTVCLTLYQQATVSYCVSSEWSSMLPCVHCECVCVSASFRMRTEQTKAQSLTLIFGAESLCCIAQSRSF